ncbi:YHYH protein [Paraglaciecola sp. L3A3]|uniref:YHYH protein n=1 Tax=Paraglaciecola sp. L3A3 TaxID=2686358 RepID=UPI00131E2E74|nr:YHYH protein [Paraglaciecola sp. L3A3]
MNRIKVVPQNFFVNKGLLVLLLLCLGLSACGGGSTAADPAIDVPVEPTPDPTPTPTVPDAKNILLIISDDQGLDASAQYAYSNDIPSTPKLDQLASAGIVFDNAWATPACTTSRANLITGKFGVNSGVTYVPAELNTDHQVLQQYLATHVATQNYVSAVFGKWHLAGASKQANHPNEVGLDYYAGNLGNVDDYYNWQLTTNGVNETSDVYHTTKITDLAADWIRQQSHPWFVWLAYSAPHAPFHLPPASLHNRALSGTSEDINGHPRQYYLAAIEAMDAEIARLIDGLDDDVRNNTVIIFVGDNGTPSRVIDTAVFNQNHGKNTLYQGGVAVPLIISGAGVTRQNERENALVTVTDLYATIGQIAGIEQSSVHDSTSFAALLDDATASTNNMIFTQFESAATTGVTVRNDTYKLIQFAGGDRELYQLSQNVDETNNIINDASVANTLTALSQFADSIVDSTVTQPINITNATLANGSGNCADYVAEYTANATDVANDRAFIGDLQITVSDNKCVFSSNAIPNHDFNDGGTAFPNTVSAQNARFEISNAPQIAASTTSLSLDVDNAILLNGVKVDLLAAGCFGVGNGKIGCNDISTPWRYDPMHPANGFNVDSHNAHAQPDGTYHYHGSPFALFADNDTQASPVIGFAADGFPIYGSYFADQTSIRKAQSSYRLKSGARSSAAGDPGGNYDGAFRDDYEYVEGLGDLDACNGMTINGVYAYYITDNYPYVLACFSGTPDLSFNKGG